LLTARARSRMQSAGQTLGAPMIDVEVARTFLDVAETSSFQLAAQRLNVTQSTVSARIRTLEERLGQRLFDRTRAGASLNSHGRAFQPYAQTIVQAWESGKRAAAKGPGLHDRLRIGGDHGLWPGMLSPWLLELRAKLADTEIEASADEGKSLVRQVLKGQLEIAVSYYASTEEGLSAERLTDDELMLVTSEPDGAFRSRYVDVKWGAEGVPLEIERPATSIELGSSSVDYLFLSQSAGYVPRRLVEPYLTAGRLHLVRKAPTFSKPIYVLLQQGTSNETVKQALALLRETIASPPRASKLKELADAFRVRMIDD
jgi:LysR family transcriptional regulator, flagellar master operon regulator